MTDDSSSLTVWQSIEILTKAILRMQEELSALNQKITLKKGAELLPNSIYEAKFKLNNEMSIATMPIIGYRMLNGELVIRNHITEEVKSLEIFITLKLSNLVTIIIS